MKETITLSVDYVGRDQRHLARFLSLTDAKETKNFDSEGVSGTLCRVTGKPNITIRVAGIY